MPDTHDERGGGEDVVTPEKAAFELRYWLDTRTGTDRLGRDVGIVLDELAAATARAEKAEAALAHANSVVDAFHAEANRMSDRYDNLHDDHDRLRARVAGIGTDWGVRFPDNQVEICNSESNAREWASKPLDGVALTVMRRDASGWRVAEAAVAAQSGLSEPVERSEASGGSFQANTSATAPAGLSGICGRRRDYHVCVLPAEHDGDHRDILNWTWTTHIGTWTDDDTTGADR